MKQRSIDPQQSIRKTVTALACALFTLNSTAQSGAFGGGAPAVTKPAAPLSKGLTPAPASPPAAPPPAPAPSPVTETVACPPNANLGLLNAPGQWVSAASPLTLSGAELTGTDSARTSTMVCRYQGAGFKWELQQWVQRNYKSCTLSGTSFTCTKP